MCAGFTIHILKVLRVCHLSYFSVSLKTFLSFFHLMMNDSKCNRHFRYSSMNFESFLRTQMEYSFEFLLFTCATFISVFFFFIVFSVFKYLAETCQYDTIHSLDTFHDTIVFIDVDMNFPIKDKLYLDLDSWPELLTW